MGLFDEKVLPERARRALLQSCPCVVCPGTEHRPGGGHAVEFKSLQKGHELSFFKHTLMLTCSERRHSVHNQRWAATSGKAALALPQPPGQDWFAAGRGCSGGVGANGSFFDGQFAGDCNGFKALSLDSRACHEFYVWRS